MDFDHCIERGYQTTSLMLNRLVNEASLKEHIEAIPYYLYKFRHSANGYYLRPWTVHNFVMKSLQHNVGVITDVLKHKVPYGVFPHVYSFNLILDHFLKESNYQDAMSCASHLFLLEYLDNEVAQTLSLEAVNKYWEENLNSNLIPEIEDLEVQRNLAGILYTIGVLRSQTNITVIGLSLLGKIEKEHDIRAVYQEPWAPLPWSEGYLQNALDTLASCSEPISQQCVDIVLHCCSEDEELSARAENIVEKLREKDLVNNDENSTLNGICESMKNQLPEFESKEIKQSLTKVCDDWSKEHQLLVECENEMRAEIEEKRLLYKENKEIDDQAHQMAVVELGFYDLEKEKIEEGNMELKVYLQENYVAGSLSELEITERMRSKAETVKDPVILTS